VGRSGKKLDDCEIISQPKALSVRTNQSFKRKIGKGRYFGCLCYNQEECPLPFPMKISNFYFKCGGWFVIMRGLELGQGR
jgi:hypothetical protein